MSWPDTFPHRARRQLLRLAGVVALGALTAGGFQPLYGDHSIGASADVRGKLASVDVPAVDVPNGTALARISVHLRNQLIYGLTGGGPAASPAYRLVIRLTASQRQVIVDVNSGRAEVVNYGLIAAYKMIDVATGKPVVNSVARSQVSYDVPGQEQRFAGARGLRDAENRAADVLAQNIQSRLASYFVAGT
ncbi:MAG: LPS assembly lipoprotein LptE [Pseudolabrys sp.]